MRTPPLRSSCDLESTSNGPNRNFGEGPFVCTIADRARHVSLRCFPETVRTGDVIGPTDGTGRVMLRSVMQRGTTNPMRALGTETVDGRRRVRQVRSVSGGVESTAELPQTLGRIAGPTGIRQSPTSG